MEKKIDFKLRKGEDFIPLIQLLKIANIAGSGGEAQAMVLGENVRLNGEIELRKRAKIRVGDVVTVSGYEVTVVVE
ncbi:MAG: RNA-binding S4 domain-containing protein [Bacteroidales bacterium]|nr:RNA-binding S4 domain-containing protein [Bacteroidales bacterium]